MYNHTAIRISQRIKNILSTGFKVKFICGPSHTLEGKKVSLSAETLINKAKVAFPNLWTFFLNGNKEVDILAKLGTKLQSVVTPLPYNAPATILYNKEIPIFQNILKTIKNIGYTSHLSKVIEASKFKNHEFCDNLTDSIMTIRSPLNNGFSKFAYKLKCNILKLPANFFKRMIQNNKDSFWKNKTKTLFPTWFCEDHNCSEKYYVCDIFHITGSCENKDLTEICDNLLLNIIKCIAKYSNQLVEKIVYNPHKDTSPSDSAPKLTFLTNTYICSSLPTNIDSILCTNCGETYHKTCVKYTPIRNAPYVIP
jgi:hypothetical protein